MKIKTKFLVRSEKRNKYTEFILKMKSKTLFITANLPLVQINGIDNQTDGKQGIINLFYWLESWQPDQAESFKTQLQNEWPMIEKLMQIRNYR